MAGSGTRRRPAPIKTVPPGRLSVRARPRSARRLRADEYARTASICADGRIPYGLTGVVAAWARRAVIRGGSVVGRRRGNRGADDGPGRETTDRPCADSATDAIRLRRGADGGDADESDG